MKSSTKTKATRTMPKSSQPLVAVEIGSKRIKAVMGRYQGGVIHIKKLCSEISPENAQYDPTQNTTAASYGLANMIKMNKLNRKNVVCTMEVADFVRRDLTVPCVKDNEIKRLLQYELSSQLPIDVSSYVIQHKITGEVQTENGPQLHIQVCAAPKAIVNHYYSILLGAGLKPVAMDINTNAIEKLLRVDSASGALSGNRNVMLIDMGNSTFNVSFYKNGIFQFSKLLETGGYVLDDIILNNAKVGRDEAERLKINNLSRLSMVALEKDYGDPRTLDINLNPERMILAQTVQAVKGWIRSAEGIIKYYVSRHATGQTIDQILLYGGNAYINDIDRLFEFALKIKTTRVESLNCLRVDRHSQQGLSEYLNVIGALVRC